MSSTAGQPQSTDQRLVVIGTEKDAASPLGTIPKDVAMKRLGKILQQVDGFEQIVGERASAVPKILFARFKASGQADTFVRSQLTAESFGDFWAAPDRPPAERFKYRPLYKIKRAILEKVPTISPNSILVDKPQRAVFRLHNGMLIEVVRVSTGGTITWANEVEAPIRERAVTLLQ